MVLLYVTSLVKHKCLFDVDNKLYFKKKIVHEDKIVDFVLKIQVKEYGEKYMYDSDDAIVEYV